MRNFLSLYQANLFRKLLLLLVILFLPSILIASDGKALSIGPVRFEFIVFALILSGIVFFHKNTFKIAVTGVIVLILLKLIFVTQFNLTEHIFGTNSFASQVLNKTMRQGEWGIILNLTGLLLGFAVLAKIFAQSGIPEKLPDYIPDDWKGGFLLLIFIFFLSAFLDNIAAALIGGTIALVIYKNKVHIGYIAAIVAASNAGGIVKLNVPVAPL